MADKAKLALYGIGLAAAALALSKVAATAPGGQLTIDQVKSRVRALKRRFHFPDADEMTVRAMVEIESNRKPYAIRAEPHISDFSAGLMQTLIGTAAWMHDIGWKSYPRPAFARDDSKYAVDDAHRVSESTAAVLFDPDTSIYFGMAYQQWLTSHSWYNGTLQWQVRGYNGGPGGATASYTEYYWDRFGSARARLEDHDKGNTGV